MFKYSFTIKTNKALERLDLRKTCYMQLDLARSEFLRFVEALNESLKLIIIYYQVKYTFGIKITFLESLRNEKKPFKGSISAKLVIMTLF